MYRKLEGENREQIQRIDQQTAARLATARADADTARATGEQLQRDIDNYVAAMRLAATDCAATQQCAPDAHPLVLLADLRRAADQRAGELAATADEARERGSACERSYDAARAMSDPAGPSADTPPAGAPDTD